MKRVEKSKVDKLVALKSLALSLSKISPEFLIDQNRLLLVLIYLFTVLDNIFFYCCKTRGLQFRKFCNRTRPRISNKFCFIGVLWSLVIQYNVGTLGAFIS